MNLVEPPQLAKPASDMVHVWQMRLTAVSSVRSLWEDWLSRDERQRLAKYCRAADRDRFLCSRGGLRYLLAGYLQQSPAAIQLQYGAQGRPALAQSSATLHFNVSHSGDWVIWAFSRCPWLGVDVEALQPRPRLRSLIQKCLTAEEQADIGREPATQLKHFLAMWTIKEAHLKAIGLGLSYPLQKVQVALQPEPAIIRPAEGFGTHAAAWRVEMWQPDATAIAAVCIGQSPCLFEFFDLSAGEHQAVEI